MRELAHLHVRQHSIAERQHRGAELVFAQPGNMIEIADLRQRISKPRDGRLRQARELRDLVIAERAGTGLKGAQDIETTSKRRDEFASLLGNRFLGHD